jgi:hypothetical protein
VTEKSAARRFFFDSAATGSRLLRMVEGEERLREGFIVVPIL